MSCSLPKYRRRRGRGDHDHPYSSRTNLSEIGRDAAETQSFISTQVYNPVKYEDEVCAAHEAGDCDWYNYMSLPVSISGVPAGDGSITQQDYPIDSPTTWVDYSTVHITALRRQR